MNAAAKVRIPEILPLNHHRPHQTANEVRPHQPPREEFGRFKGHFMILLPMRELSCQERSSSKRGRGGCTSPRRATEPGPGVSAVTAAKPGPRGHRLPPPLRFTWPAGFLSITRAALRGAREQEQQSQPAAGVSGAATASGPGRR